MINILYPFFYGSFGGGNNFLFSLRNELINRHKYTNFWSAKIILINSHHFGRFNIFILYLAIKRIFGKKFIIVHRIDGSLVIGRNSQQYLRTDKLIYLVNRIFANYTIFQSEWAKNMFNELYPNYSFKNPFVLHNYPRINFDNLPTHFQINCGKIRVLYCSWSTNELKGFETLKFLDENLNFDHFEVHFVGRLPGNLVFNRIKCLGVLDEVGMAMEFSRASVFLGLMQNDACSNALIEAQAAGLQIIYLDSGGNKEVIHERSICVENSQHFAQILHQFVESRDHLQRLSYQRITADQYVCKLASLG